MFSNRKKEEILWEKVKMIRPTSKSELKQTCLYLSNLDVDKAKKMYEFLVGDMSEIPEVPPTAKPFMQNFGEQANGVIGWIEDHQDFFGKAYDLIKNIVSSRKATPPVSAPLPPINQ